jgi:predicted hydrocarbon binding protein
MMSENPFLDGLVHDKSTGALRYKSVRYLLIRPETITGFQKAIAETWGDRAHEKLFAGGYTGGCLSSRKYREQHDFSDQEIIEFMMSMGNQIGWGNFYLEGCDMVKKVLRISVSHSPFAESYGSSPAGVCHLIRGVLAGMASVVFENDCVAAEKECLAKGDQRCLFIVEASQAHRTPI